MVLAMLAGGVALLALGGQLLVSGAVAIAERLRVSPLLIGMTLVGFGTSTPELVTSIQATLAGAPNVAVGNVVGSNIANVLLILGVAALIGPFVAKPAAFVRDGAAVVAATAIAIALVLTGEVSRLIGGLLVLLLASYLVIAYLIERRGVAEEPAPAASSWYATAPAGGFLALIACFGGFLIVVIGAELLVTGAISVARDFEVSETMIGLTIVAFGTSLPELAASAMAALRGRSDLAFGNVLGSNLFNVLGILGATAIVTPLGIPEEIARFDIWVMAATTAALVWVVWTGWRVTRLEGALLLGGYAAYIVALVAMA